jgi:hypothetical protein
MILRSCNWPSVTAVYPSAFVLFLGCRVLRLNLTEDYSLDSLHQYLQPGTTDCSARKSMMKEELMGSHRVLSTHPW